MLLHFRLKMFNDNPKCLEINMNSILKADLVLIKLTGLS